MRKPKKTRRVMPPRDPIRVYVAGPLFSQSEREFDERIAAICEGLGFETFLPHRDAGLQLDGDDSARAIYAADVCALERADVVVANLDGCDVDAGTAWEIGYAIASGTPCFGVRTDRRWLEPFSRVNLMIERSVTVVYTLDELLETIRRGVPGARVVKSRRK